MQTMFKQEEINKAAMVKSENSKSKYIFKK